MENRQALHTLVDELPEPELPAAKRFLEYLRQAADPLRLVLESAPVDDEPLTEEDLAAIREGFADRAEGETVSHEEVKRLFREAK
jgi:predicted transcriptional regulator